MVLLTTIDPVEALDKVSGTISEHNIFVVLAALMILSFIGMAILIFKINKNANDKIVVSQDRVEKQNERIIDQNKTITALLGKIAETETNESLMEQTKWNTEKILKMSFDANLVELYNGVCNILAYNHISDTAFTEQRIRGLVNAKHLERVKMLNSFRYKNTRIGEIANAESWIDEKIAIISKFIFTPEKNKDILIRDLQEAYTKFYNQLKF